MGLLTLEEKSKLRCDGCGCKDTKKNKLLIQVETGPLRIVPGGWVRCEKCLKNYKKVEIIDITKEEAQK